MHQIQAINPFTNEITYIDSNESEGVYGVDPEGNYLGIVPKGPGVTQVDYPPKDPKLKWLNGRWTYVPNLQEAIDIALSSIDAKAGATRLRFLTEVPGQQATYLLKSQEAEAYLQDSTQVGKYLLAESTATGLPLNTVAQQIKSMSDNWNNIIGPAIEGIRIKYKAAIKEAASLDEVTSIETTATGLLNAVQ